MDHIFDNVGIDISSGTKLRVPHDLYASFPAASVHRGGFFFDTGLNTMYYSDGTIWKTFGSLTSFGAGDLSPLFTTSVVTPTTTPVLSFALSNVSQYQVFGRSAAGSGVPSWITLPSTAFTGYTAGTGISIAGNVITNTGGLWQSSSNIIEPISSAVNFVRLPQNSLTTGQGAGIQRYYSGVKLAEYGHYEIGGAFAWVWHGWNGASTSEYMRLVAGNLLINKTTDSGQKLQVNGTSKFDDLLTGTDSIWSKTVSIGFGSGTSEGFNITKTITALNKHSFECTSSLIPTSGGLGYGTFDANTYMYGAVNNDHFIAFQARPVYGSSGTLGISGQINNPGSSGNALVGFYSELKVTSGLVYTSAQMLLTDTLGAGTVQDNYGIYIRDIIKGTNLNYALFTNAGKVRLGDVSVNNAATSLMAIDVNGLVEQRTVASLGIPTYTAGTGISIVGGVITNTLPSLWQRSGTVLSPLTNYDTVYLSGASGSINSLIKLDYLSAGAGNGARIDFTYAGSNMLGYLSSDNITGSFITRLYGRDGVSLRAEFSSTDTIVLTAKNDKTVWINTIPNYNAGTQILVNNSGVISYRDFSTFGASKWTDGTAGSIYRNTKVGIKNSAPTYDLDIIGQTRSTLELISNTGLTINGTGVIDVQLNRASNANFQSHLNIVNLNAVQTSGGIAMRNYMNFNTSGSFSGTFNVFDNSAVFGSSTSGSAVLNLINNISYYSSNLTAFTSLTGVNNMVWCQTASAGTIYGEYTSVRNVSGSTTHIVGTRLDIWSGATNSKGILILSSDVGIPSGNYAIYSALSYQSYLEGNLGLGINVATAKLDVNGDARIRTITQDDALTKVLVADANGYIKWRNYSTFGGGGGSVWKIQSSSTDATSVTDNIWHNGKVAIGNYAASTSSYFFTVAGTSYFTQTMLLNNNTAFQAFNSSASPVEVFKVDSSNNWLFGASHIKINATDIYLDQYPNTRLDNFYTVPVAKLFYSDVNGKLLLTDQKAFYNDHTSYGSETQQGQAADTTWRRLTNDSSKGTTSYSSQFGLNYTTFAGQILRGNQQYRADVTVEYENQSGSSGTPKCEFQIRMNGSTTGVTFPNWKEETTGIRNTISFSSIILSSGSGYYDIDIYVRVISGSGSIYVNRHLTILTNVGYQGL